MPKLARERGEERGGGRRVTYLKIVIKKVLL